MPQQMELDITVTLTGQQNPNTTWSIDAAYSMTRSLPVSTNVVSATGAIDLTQMNKTDEYTNSTVMRFTLNNTVVDKDGHPAMAIFPTPRSDAVEFTAAPNHGRPTAPPESEFTVSPSNEDISTLIFTDIDNSDGSYGYCLKVKCWPIEDMYNFALVPLDPPIVNRRGDG